MLNPGTGERFSSGHSRKGQEAAKGCPLNRGSVASEFTDNFVHPSNQPLNKGRLGDMGVGGNFLEIQVSKIIYDIIRRKRHQNVH